MTILGKKTQSDFLCDGELYAIGGDPPIMWRNDHYEEYPAFGVFKIVDTIVDEDGGMPIIIGTRPDGEEDSIYGFNLSNPVGENNYGCCALDFPLIAKLSSSVGQAGEQLGVIPDSMLLHPDASGYISMGISNSGLCLIREHIPEIFEQNVRFAQVNAPIFNFFPNTIAPVYYTRWECISGEPNTVRVCTEEWMWAGYAFMGFEAIPFESELELTFHPEMQELWDCVVPPDDPEDPTMPRNRGPWFISDVSCGPTIPGIYPECENPLETSGNPAPSGVEPIFIGNYL